CHGRNMPPTAALCLFRGIPLHGIPNCFQVLGANAYEEWYPGIRFRGYRTAAPRGSFKAWNWRSTWQSTRHWRRRRLTNHEPNAESADVLTEVSRGIDKWLWMVEAHQQVSPEEASTAEE